MNSFYSRIKDCLASSLVVCAVVIASAEAAKAAIFTVEFAGTISEASSNFNSPTRVGDRITGSYAFDDTDNQLIEINYGVARGNSPDRPDTAQPIPNNFTLRPEDDSIQQDIAGGLLTLSSSASRTGASFSREDRGDLVPVFSTRQFSVDAQTFSESFSAALSGNAASGQFSGLIDRFELRASTANPESVPEPAFALGLGIVAAVGLAQRNKKSRATEREDRYSKVRSSV